MSVDETTSTATAAYAVTLGERLRNVRVQQDLSLHDVEQSSEGRFKASVLGAYERGERAVSVSRLRGLAEFYRVPLTELIPGAGLTSASDQIPLGGLRIDLSRLDVAPFEDAATIGRFVNSVKSRRGDYNGRIITIRRDDLRALAAVLDIAPSELRDRLLQAGIVADQTLADDT